MTPGLLPIHSYQGISKGFAEKKEAKWKSSIPNHPPDTLQYIEILINVWSLHKFNL